MSSISTAASAERRTEIRYACGSGDDGPVIVAQGKDARWARVRDVSSAGIGLQVSGPFALGTEIALRFCGGAEERASLRGEVRFAARQADGSWAIGCRLDGPAARAGPAGKRFLALLGRESGLREREAASGG